MTRHPGVPWKPTFGGGYGLSYNRSNILAACRHRRRCSKQDRIQCAGDTRDEAPASSAGYARPDNPAGIDCFVRSQHPQCTVGRPGGVSLLGACVVHLSFAQRLCHPMAGTALPWARSTLLLGYTHPWREMEFLSSLLCLVAWCPGDHCHSRSWHLHHSVSCPDVVYYASRAFPGDDGRAARINSGCLFAAALAQTSPFRIRSALLLFLRDAGYRRRLVALEWSRGSSTTPHAEPVAA